MGKGRGQNRVEIGGSGLYGPSVGGGRGCAEGEEGEKANMIQPIVLFLLEKERKTKLKFI